MSSKFIQKAQNIISKARRFAPVDRAMNKLGFQHYDLPLHKNEDSRFLILLIALMSFLAVLSGSGSMALGNMASYWSSGLENKITIEISGETKSGGFLAQSTIEAEVQKIYKALQNKPYINSIEALENNDIREIISPWIDENLTLNGIAMPGLLTVELKDDSDKALDTLTRDLEATSELAEIRTHYEWLDDVIGFTSSLHLVALSVLLIVLVVTIIAVTTAIRTRLALHSKEVGLLHNMGATDLYITRQFQRHALLFSLQGAMLGTLIGILFIAIITLFSSSSESALVPVLKIGFGGFVSLLFIPLVISTIATVTSRFTVLQNLSKMP